MNTQPGSIENLIQEKQSYNSLIDHFNKIGAAIASSSGITDILKQITDCASQFLYADPVVLFKYDKNKSRLVTPLIYSGKLYDQEEYVTTFVFSGDTFAELIIQNGTSLYFETQEEIEAHPYMNKEKSDKLPGRPVVRFHRRENIQSMAALVLKVGGEPVGLMFLNYRTQQPFSDSVKKLMQTFASYAAVALNNSILFDDLRNKEAFLGEIIEKTPSPVFVLQMKLIEKKIAWQIEIANKAAHVLLGYDFNIKELQGNDVKKMLESVNEFDKLRQVLRENAGEVYNIETALPGKSGKVVPMSISTAILEKDSANRISRTICIAKDLTKNKDIENQLTYLNRATISLLSTSNLEQAYDTIFANLKSIGYNEGMISLVDEENKMINGVRATGQNWQALVAKTSVPLNSTDVLARVVRTGKDELIKDCENHPFCNQELIKAGGIKSQYIMPLVVQQKPIGTLQIGLSDKQELLLGDKYHLTESLNVLSAFANQVAVAIEANRQKDRINKLQSTLADIGHEFRSPLHNIISQMGGLVYHLKKTYGEDPKVKQIAKIIEEESYRGERQMRNALFSADASFKSMGKDFEKHNISETVIYCADRFRETAKRRNINIIVYDNVRKLPAIYYDKTHIEQVFTNLIDNAVKYSQSQQNIEIKGEDHGRKIEISIKDIGLGIPERSYDKIFDGFTRSDVLDPSRFIPGTGLGLKIAREFVETHKGKILVASKPFSQDRHKIDSYQGYATTFIVLLPKNPKEY